MPRRPIAGALLCCALRGLAHAQDEDPPSPYGSTVQGQSASRAASSSSIRNTDFELRPMTAPGDILRVVPGLLAVQHQGGGKADQLFLRGFDADHGTDVALFVDGIPVNLPSHAHGQGYADLHWILPEAVERIDVVKGPYDARYGDFATGGAVNLVTRRDFDRSSVSFTVGGFPTRGCSGGLSDCRLVAQERLAAVLAPKLSGWAKKLHPFVAAEVARDQGPFDAPMVLWRYNVLGKLSYELSPRTEIGAFVSAYGSAWNSSGQIPAREVEARRLSHFGAEDPSEGGRTERQGASIFLHHKDGADVLDASVYFTRYRLALWNDFTLFLHDPQRSDEIEQDDARFITGLNLSYRRSTRWRGLVFHTTVGTQLRYDAVHVDVWNATSQDGAYRQRVGRRADPSTFHFGNDTDVDQLNLALFVEEDVRWTRWLRSIVGLRADYFGWLVDDHSRPTPASGMAHELRMSPKATGVLSPHRMLDLYLNFGMGFHSNDARISVQADRTTPDGPVRDVLPAIYAGELGARFRYERYLSITAALWASYLESETVFVGDDATFAPAGATRRYGVDVDLGARPLPWLDLDVDIAQAVAQVAASGADLALAPRLYVTAGIGATWRGLRAGLRVRYLGARPAFDSDSVEYTAWNTVDPRRVNTAAYVVADLYAAYRHRWLEAGLSIQNLGNVRWREAQVGTGSCTRDEASSPTSRNYGVCGRTLAADLRTGVPDVHYTPGVPFNLQLMVKAYF